MIRPALKSRWTGLQLAALFCLGLLASRALAQPQTSPVALTNRPAPERFLIILDISAPMQKRASNVQRVVGQLFSSGLQGQMDRGDSIGVWTYNDELHTGEYPLLRWSKEAGGEITIGLVQFVQKQIYSKSPNLSPVMAQLTNVVAKSEKITVILFSDGSQSLAGTPFDAQIAQAFALNQAEQRKQSMPFVTILRAARGEFVSVKVNTPPWPVEIPGYPGEAATVTPELPEPTVPVVSEPVEAQPAPLPTNLPVVSTVEPPPVEPPPAAPVTPPVVESKIAPAQVQTNLPPEPTVTATATSGKLPLIPIVAGVAVVVVGFAALLLALTRRSREPRVSLITRSMNKDEK